MSDDRSGDARQEAQAPSGTRSGRREFLARATKGAVAAAVAIGLVGAKEASAESCSCSPGPWVFDHCQYVECGNGGRRYTGNTIQSRNLYSPDPAGGCTDSYKHYCGMQSRSVYDGSCTATVCNSLAG